MEIKPREAAYKAVTAAFREEAYVADVLQQWTVNSNPSESDLHLAWEIANGTTRMRLALDHISKQCADRLNLKLKERTLLYTALYQFFFMSRIPLYAIADETVSL